MLTVDGTKLSLTKFSIIYFHRKLSNFWGIGESFYHTEARAKTTELY